MLRITSSWKSCIWTDRWDKRLWMRMRMLTASQEQMKIKFLLKVLFRGCSSPYERRVEIRKSNVVRIKPFAAEINSQKALCARSWFMFDQDSTPRREALVQSAESQRMRFLYLISPRILWKTNIRRAATTCSFIQSLIEYNMFTKNGWRDSSKILIQASYSIKRLRIWVVNSPFFI